MSFLELSPTLSIINQNPGSTFDFNYLSIKNMILPKEYLLTIVFATAVVSENLHKQHKKKSGPATVLSFPYGDAEGEIILHVPTIYARAYKENHNKQDHVAYHIIHGMLHLAGFDHGKLMDAAEKKYLQKFDFSIPPSLFETSL